MTPFGIRKKIKSFLGLGGEPVKTDARKDEIPRFDVVFVQPDGKEFTVQAKKLDSIVMASGRGDYPVPTGCADSSCGTCRVEVLEGVESLAVEDPHEESVKADNKVPGHLRLGCQTAIIGAGVKIQIIDLFAEQAAEA